MATSNTRVRLRAIQSLRELGFREIEAQVYTYLLANPPTTGYRVSHAIGKPVANTYKAIAELSRRGAIQVDDGTNRLVRAVPIAELLAQIERADREKRIAAEEALIDLGPPDEDDRIYSLRSIDQVRERARAMIARAQATIVADLFPRPFSELRTDLLEAAQRGVRVAAKVYQDAGPGGEETAIDIVRAVEFGLVLSSWPGQQISLVCDAEEHLLALLSAEMDSVHQAIWSKSAFLSCMHHNHVAIEIAHTRMRTRDPRAGSDPTLLLESRPPGLAALQARFAASRPSPETAAGHRSAGNPTPGRGESR